MESARPRLEIRALEEGRLLTRLTVERPAVNHSPAEIHCDLVVEAAPSSGHRDNRSYDCPSHNGIDFQPPADLMQALAHAGQPDARAPRPDLPTDERRYVAYCGHSPARVLDRQHGVPSIACFLAREPNSCGRTLGVTGDVRQRLLHKTEQHQFGIARQPFGVGGHFEIDRGWRRYETVRTSRIDC
jgi:hypothetical protein